MFPCELNPASAVYGQKSPNTESGKEKIRTDTRKPVIKISEKVSFQPLEHRTIKTPAGAFREKLTNLKQAIQSLDIPFGRSNLASSYKQALSDLEASLKNVDTPITGYPDSFNKLISTLLSDICLPANLSVVQTLANLGMGLEEPQYLYSASVPASLLRQLLENTDSKTAKKILLKDADLFQTRRNHLLKLTSREHLGDCMQNLLSGMRSTTFGWFAEFLQLFQHLPEGSFKPDSLKPGLDFNKRAASLQEVIDFLGMNPTALKEKEKSIQLITLMQELKLPVEYQVQVIRVTSSNIQKHIFEHLAFFRQHRAELGLESSLLNPKGVFHLRNAREKLKACGLPDSTLADIAFEADGSTYLQIFDDEENTSLYHHYPYETDGVEGLSPAASFEGIRLFARDAGRLWQHHFQAPDSLSLFHNTAEQRGWVPTPYFGGQSTPGCLGEWNAQDYPNIAPAPVGMRDWADIRAFSEHTRTNFGLRSGFDASSADVQKQIEVTELGKTFYGLVINRLRVRHDTGNLDYKNPGQMNQLTGELVEECTASRQRNRENTTLENTTLKGVTV